MISSPLTESIIKDELIPEINLKLNLIKSLSFSSPSFISEYLMKTIKHYKLGLSDLDIHSSHDSIILVPPLPNTTNT